MLLHRNFTGVVMMMTRIMMMMMMMMMMMLMMMMMMLPHLAFTGVVLRLDISCMMGELAFL